MRSNCTTWSPVTGGVIALTKLTSDSVRSVTDTFSALARPAAGAERGRGWGGGRPERDQESQGAASLKSRQVREQTTEKEGFSLYLQVDSGFSGLVWLPEHSQERPK